MAWLPKFTQNPFLSAKNGKPKAYVPRPHGVFCAIAFMTNNKAYEDIYVWVFLED